MLDNNNFGFWGNGSGGGGGGGGTVTAVGLCMPPAFAVSNSPVTSAGNLCVQGAGLASQYIRGDGTLADFPNVGGGAGSQQYYFNGGVSQGTIGGQASYQMSKTANTGAAANFPITGNGLMAQFITDIGSPNQLLIPAGSWFFSAYFSSSNASGTPSIYAVISKWDGSTLTTLATSATEVITNGTSVDLYNFAAALPDTVLLATDRIVVTFYSTNTGGRTLTLYTQSTNLSSVTTTFPNGITSLNGLTANTQYFQTTTCCTDFTIVSSGNTHCFNLPTASCTNRGALSSADYCLFYNNALCSPYIKDAQSNIRATNQDIAVYSTCFATISGGRQNQINYNSFSFIGGGYNNQITFGVANVIAGGYTNCIQFTGGVSNYSFIGGGLGNLVRSNSNYGNVVGGSNNCLISAAYGAILNGNLNFVSNSYGVILSGECNTVTGCYAGAFGCGINASVDNTFYFCHLCLLGNFRNSGSVQLAGIANSVAGGNILYFDNATKCVSFGGLTSGTAVPTGGVDGDIYLQYV